MEKERKESASSLIFLIWRLLTMIFAILSIINVAILSTTTREFLRTSIVCLFFYFFSIEELFFSENPVQISFKKNPSLKENRRFWFLYNLFLIFAIITCWLKADQCNYTNLATKYGWFGFYSILLFI